MTALEGGVLRRMAPLNALRAFEVVARCASVTSAAKDLGVTPSAVSQHLRALEDHAGAALFDREGRHLVLTPLGAELYDLVHLSFAQLQRASDLIYRAGETRSLRVTTTPTFAAKWLTPRLSRFTRAHPYIEVWILADVHVADIAGGRVDIAVRYGAGQATPLASIPLFSADVVAVASPSLFEGRSRPARPADLAEFTLIHSSSTGGEETYVNWDEWFAARRAPGIAAGSSLRVDRCAVAIEAALYGAGIALAPRAFVEDDIASGRLTPLFAADTPNTDLGYHLLTRPGPSTHDIRAFVAWIRAEATLDRGVPDTVRIDRNVVARARAAARLSHD